MAIQAQSSRALSSSDLFDLLKPFSPTFYGLEVIAISAITEDSRRVSAGSLFVARQGENVDGRRYCKLALEAGASALLCEAESPSDLEPRIEVDDIYGAWAAVSLALVDNPQEQLELIGITGTNGKTSTAYLVQAALETLSVNTARSGTLGFFVGADCLSESLTTPQPDQLAQLLGQAVQLGAEACVMEVSSHALVQGRTKGLAFSCVAFSNLTQDHLDYHGSLEGYQKAKEKLFFEYASKSAVINLDDPVGMSLATRLQARKLPIIGVSTQGQKAELSVEVLDLSAHGFRVKVNFAGQSIVGTSPLLGRHNLDNWALALGILCSINVDLKAAVLALAEVEGAPGRMQRVKGPVGSPVVLVDYAHTPDALGRAIQALRETGAQELRLVFGCGGDRDQGKRALMGKAAVAADRVWLTSDNPRSEEPKSIIDEIAEGLKGSQTPFSIEVQRRDAIRASLQGANAKTVILIAGKGHEAYQVIGDQTLPFDDCHEAQQILMEQFSEAVV